MVVVAVHSNPVFAVVDRAPPVVIIGGGVIGCACAFFLSTLDSAASIVLIERSAELASFASGRAGGFLARDWSDELASESFDLLAGMDDAFKAAVDFRRVHVHAVRVDPAHPESRRVGADVAPFLSEQAISAGTIGTVDDCAQVHPARFTRELFARAQQARPDGSVRRIQGDVTGIVGDRTVLFSDADGSQQTLTAAAIVLAVGPWSQFAASWFSGQKTAALLRSVVPQKAHSIVVAVPDGAPPRCFFLDVPHLHSKMESPEIYLRPDRTAYVCAGLQRKEAALENNADVVETDSETAASLLQLLKCTLAPGMCADETLVEQACFLPARNSPIIERVPGTALVIATGHSVWGILKAMGTGKRVRAEIAKIFDER